MTGARVTVLGNPISLTQKGEGLEFTIERANYILMSLEVKMERMDTCRPS